MITDKATPTPYPHYTNPYFQTARTVYQSPTHRLDTDGYVKGAEYNYSDRLTQWHSWEKSKQADEAAKTSGFNRWSAGWAEVWLRSLLDDPDLELVHMMAGYNLSNGYGYWVYGYIKGNGDDQEA